MINTVRERVQRALKAAPLWPVTAVYLAGTACLMALAGGLMNLSQAVTVFGVFTLLVILVGVLRELRTVHSLVNSQHDALVARIGQLHQAMTVAKIAIPIDPSAHRTGRTGHEQ